jgi:hypothetical protein
VGSALHGGLFRSQRPLRLLQETLAMLLPRAALEERPERFAPAYDSHYTP